MVKIDEDISLDDKIELPKLDSQAVKIYYNKKYLTKFYTKISVGDKLLIGGNPYVVADVSKINGNTSANVEIYEYENLVIDN